MPRPQLIRAPRRLAPRSLDFIHRVPARAARSGVDQGKQICLDIGSRALDLIDILDSGTELGPNLIYSRALALEPEGAVFELGGREGGQYVGYKS